jgi:hypothetical protein
MRHQYCNAGNGGIEYHSMTQVRPNHAAVAFAAAAPEIKKLHARAERVAATRKKLIASITDPSLRASVS